ncbi:MAG: 4Fe-4S binding protein [Candidatus Heimdallarchaeota archaeon]|nr:4Fe-4S binding protein [Candidatus Heimdallarchaeota archaeon]
METYIPQNKPNFMINYQYRQIPVYRLEDLEREIDKIKNSGKLSNNETYRSYINEMKFQIPDDFPEAKSLFIFAVENKPLKFKAKINGGTKDVTIPPQYYLSGLASADMEELIKKTIFKDESITVKRAAGLHLKFLANKTGLGRYGRNNLCYVEGMGTMLMLLAYFTDANALEDDYTDMKMMSRCENCRICLNSCPNGAISEDNFVVDVSKCITLYNETKEDIPEWINRTDVHNALMGCMKCQEKCPENKLYIDNVEWLEDMSDAVVMKLLNGSLEKEDHIIYDKVLLSDEERMEIFSRNMQLLISTYH